jgi:predicted DNA-binding transcriptional regulator YafY
MPKRSDTVETVTLALELLRRIPRNRSISVAELHEQLSETGIGRDRRTIQRQLKMLSEHFDIARDDSSKPYGYRWKESAKCLSVPILSNKESLLLLMAQQQLKNLLPPSVMASMDGFFQQARSNLGPLTTAKQERDWLSKIRVVNDSLTLIPPKIDPEILERVSNALFGNFWLNIAYQNRSGIRSKSDIMPLGLAQQGPRLYLVCRYKDQDNERTLALHRIVSAHVSTLTFERPKGFSLQKYDDDGRFGFGEGTKVRLTFRIDKEAGSHLLEYKLSHDQEVKEIGDQLEIKATVIDSAHLDWWLNGFGDAVSRVKRVPIKESAG